MKKQASLAPETERTERPVEGLLSAPLSDSPLTVLMLIERRTLVNPCPYAAQYAARSSSKTGALE